MYHAGISSGETYRRNAKNSKSHRDAREASLAKGIKWPGSVSPERTKKLCKMSGAALKVLERWRASWSSPTAQGELVCGTNTHLALEWVRTE